MLSTHTERPRELRWFHAGAMLYGDWGTSRFYVLGLALFFALHASFWYVLAVGVLVAAVGWAYTIICRCYPDGGGVYSAARHKSQYLAVVGALLLFADYIVTAALSAYDGIRYMGGSNEAAPYVAMSAIFVIGVINYIGPRKAGTFALLVAMATLFLTVILTILSVPHLSAGWSAIHAPTEPVRVQWSSFVAVILALSGVEAIANMTGIMVHPVDKTSKKAIWPVLLEVVILNLILAVAMNGLPAAGYDLGAAPGNAYKQVELIKEQTGWQTNPEAQAAIAREAELAHVTPQQLLAQSEELKTHIDDSKDAVLRVMAKVYADPHLFLLHIGPFQFGFLHIGRFEIGFSTLCGLVFGFLLLSAVNTAVADMVSIQYVMSRDTELPHILTRLNFFGVPWYALLAAVGLPVIILNIFQKLDSLASLYAVGVVGAITINLGSCALNWQMPVKKRERAALGLLAVILLAIEATLLWEKPDARYFALFVLGAGLSARFFTKTYPLLQPRGRGLTLIAWTAVMLAGAIAMVYLEVTILDKLRDNVAMFQSYPGTAPYAVYTIIGLLLMAAGSSASYGVRYLVGKIAVPAAGPLAAPRAGPLAEVALAGAPVDMSKSRVLVATRGGRSLLEFAANYCHKTDAVLFVLFVRQVNVTMTGGAAALTIREDLAGGAIFRNAAEICQKCGVAMIPIYAVSPDVPYTILDFAVTYGAEAVLMGVSREGAFLRALRGDVISAVADHLPKDIALLIHA